MKWPRARVWKCSAKARLTRRAADRADDRHRLGGEFLAGDDAEARGDLGDQPGEEWRAFARPGPAGEEARAFG